MSVNSKSPGRVRLRNALLAVSIVSLAACTSIGPTTIPRDRFDYNTAISNSWKEQTLLNVVKLRYADMPVFVEVASVVGGYTLETSVNAGYAQAEVGGESEGLGALGGAGKFTDRPTITYAPITGQGFNRSFLTPIPPEVILFMVQSGWRADIIFELAVDSINGLRSRIDAGFNRRKGDDEFYRVVQIIRDIQTAGGVGLQLVEDDDSGRKGIMIIHRTALDEKLVAEIAELREILAIPQDDFELSLDYGYLPTDEAQVAMISRSMLQIIVKLAHEVAVPPQHIADGRSMPSAVDNNPAEKLVNILFSTEEPEDAFVSVEYADHWFYIDNRDFDSKVVFTLVMLMMSLMEGGDNSRMPLVTIPAG